MFGVRLMEMLVKILIDIERSILAKDSNIRIVSKVLMMVLLFIEKGNKTIKEK